MPVSFLAPPVIVGGRTEDRVVFAYPHAFDVVPNDRLLEYDPEQRWVMRHQLGKASGDHAITSLANKGGILYAAVPTADAIYSVFDQTPGSDAGVLYDTRSNYRTPWLQPNGGGLARVERVRIQGLLATGGTTTLDAKVYRDWDRSTADTYAIGADLRGGDASDDLEATMISSLGQSRAFAFEFVPGTAAGTLKIAGVALTTRALEQVA